MKFLLAFDGSSGAVASAEFLKKLIKEDDVVEGIFVLNDTTVPMKVNFFDGIRTVESIDDLLKSLDDLFNAIFENHKNKSFKYFVQERSNIADEIVRYAITSNVDLIVTGTRKLKGFQKIILGSISSEILSKSPKPVMIVPP